MMTNKLAPFLVSVALLGGCDAEDPSTPPSSEERDAEAAIAPDVLALVEANPAALENASVEDMASLIEEAIDAELAGEDPQPVFDELEVLLEDAAGQVSEELAAPDTAASVDPLIDDFAADQRPQAYNPLGCLTAYNNAGKARDSANNADMWGEKVKDTVPQCFWKTSFAVEPAEDALTTVGELTTDKTKYTAAISDLILSISASNKAKTECSVQGSIYATLAKIYATDAVSRSWQSFYGLSNCI